MTDTDKLAEQFETFDIGAAVRRLLPSDTNISVHIHLPENVGFFKSGDNRGIIQALGRTDPRKKQAERTGGFDVTLRKDGDTHTKHPNKMDVYRMPYKYIGPDDVAVREEADGIWKVRITTGSGTFVKLWPCTTKDDFTCTTIDDIRDLADWILIKAGNRGKFNRPPEEEVRKKLMAADLKLLDERIAEREKQQFLKEFGDRMDELKKGGKRKTRKRKRKYKRRKTCKGGKSKKRTQKRGKKRKARKTRRH